MSTGFLIEKFRFFFLAFSLIPLLLLVYFYSRIEPESGSLNISETQLGAIIVLVAIINLLGFFGMRRLLVTVSSFSGLVSSVISGNRKENELQKFKQGDSEVADMAKSFGEVISRLEDNVRELEETKETLHNTLYRVAETVSSTKETETLCKLILETAIEALKVESGVIFCLKEDSFAPQSWVTPREYSTSKILEDANSYLTWIVGEGQILIVSKDSSYHSKSEKLFKPPLVCAPLNYGGELRGALLLSGRDGQSDFTRDEIHLIANLSSQIATLFENAELNDQRERTYFETMAALVQAVEARDSYSCGHSNRVGLYAVEIGRRLGLSETELHTLRDAAQLHDIGKIGISDTILLKTGSLTSAEMEIMKQHPKIGESILRPLKTFRSLLHPICHHHEFLDGSGYPDGLFGEEIPLITRILSVSDIYDAMTSDRPYRKAMDKEQAFETLSGLIRDGKIDPAVVSALKKAVYECSFNPADQNSHQDSLNYSGAIPQIHKIVAAPQKY